MEGTRTEKTSNSGALLCLGACLAAGFLLQRATRSRKYSFRGKSVVITGGSRGFGLEMARVFASRGANLCLIARTAAALAAAKAELERYGVRVVAIVCDVRDRLEVETALSQAAAELGDIDVLVNNAGVIQAGPYESMDLEDYEKAMAVHAWGPLYSMMAVLPRMRRRREGRIVNISSIGGKVGVPHLAPYCMSKFALAGLSESLANEVARDGVVVTTVYPGLMRTGSHVNASFKGNHEAEFALFSFAASAPVSSMNSARAARQVVDACSEGRAEVVLTPQARAAALAAAVTPRLVRGMMSTTASFLPDARAEASKESRTGWESRSSWSPSILTRLGDKAIDRNNENL